MANSLRAKLSKLRHDGHITDAEYQAFIKKLDEHDREVYNKGYEEGKSRQLLAEIKIDKDMLREMIDEKIKEFAVDIQATRNAAIDEFVKKICEKYTEEESKGYYKQYCANIKQDIADMAEQMKGGGNSDN